MKTSFASNSLMTLRYCFFVCCCLRCILSVESILLILHFFIPQKEQVRYLHDRKHLDFIAFGFFGASYSEHTISYFCDRFLNLKLNLLLFRVEFTVCSDK